jgi:hypothetical protein
MDAGVVESAVERAPAQLGGTRHGRIHLLPGQRRLRRGQEGVDELHHVIGVYAKSHLGVFHVSSMGDAGWKSKVSSGP